MFLHEYNSELFQRDDSERLAAFEVWQRHYSAQRYSHASDASREAFAELSATTEAISRGWTTGDRAVDMSVAVSSYPEFLTTYGPEEVEPRRLRIQALIDKAPEGSQGQIVISVDHRLSRRRPEIRTGVLSGIDLFRMLPDMDGSYKTARLAMDTNGHTNVSFGGTVSDNDLTNLRMDQIDRVFPVHGTWKRLDGETPNHHWDHVTLDEGYPSRSKMYGPYNIRPVEFHIGEAGVEAFLKVNIPEGNKLDPYLYGAEQAIEAARSVLV